MNKDPLACLGEKLKSLVTEQDPLPIPTNEEERTELQAHIMQFMKECCVSQVQYIQNSDPPVLTILAIDSDCGSTRTLEVIYSVDVEGSWTEVHCCIVLGKVTVTCGDGTIFEILNVECKPRCGPKGCKPYEKCGGQSCKKKCCYKREKCCKKSKYIVRDHDDQDYDTCCWNTTDKCRPFCEYKDPCYQ